MIYALLVSIVVFSALDLIWIKFVMLSLYQQNLQEILLMNQAQELTIRYLPALMAYFLLIFSLWSLILIPFSHLELEQLLKKAAVTGACLYGTYSLTCWSLFKGFTATLAFADMIWGACLYTLTTLITIKLFPNLLT